MNEIIAELEKLKAEACRPINDVRWWKEVTEKNIKDFNEQVQINRTLLQRFEESQAENKKLEESLQNWKKKKWDVSSDRATRRLEGITKLHEQRQALELELESLKVAALEKASSTVKAPGYVTSGYELVSDSAGNKCVLPKGFSQEGLTFKTLYFKVEGS